MTGFSAHGKTPNEAFQGDMKWVSLKARDRIEFYEGPNGYGEPEVSRKTWSLYVHEEHKYKVDTKAWKLSLWYLDTRMKLIRK